MLAALRLGAIELIGMGIDWSSLEVSRQCLNKNVPGSKWSVSRSGIFDIDPKSLGHFDVVHSWSVLHPNGDTSKGIGRAVEMMEGHEILVIEIYKKSPSCGFWRIEKRI